MTARTAEANESVVTNSLPASAAAKSSACGSSAFSSRRREKFAASDHLAEERAATTVRARIHPQIERAVMLDREPARGIIELHRGDPEIGKNDIGAAIPSFANTCGKPGEIGTMRGEGSAPKPSPCKRDSVRGSSIGSASRPSNRPSG